MDGVIGGFRALIALGALLVMDACRNDPFYRAPALPEPAVRTEWWSAWVKGQRVGVEQRVFGEGQQASRRTSFAFRHGNDTAWVHLASLTRCDVDGCKIISEDGERFYAGAIVPELWPPERAHHGTLIDAGGVKDGGNINFDAPLVLSWIGRAGRTTLWLDTDGRPTRARFGVIDWQREETKPPAAKPVDVAQLLALPVPRVVRPRSSLIGEYFVDGRAVRIDVPTWAELPAERTAVQAMVRDVADAVRDDFVPGSRGSTGLFGGKRGDCTEHALALVETARARGYHARSAVGYLYVDGAQGGQLVLHAWAEMELSGRWVGADAALRQFPADATHLRIGDWIEDLPDAPSIEIRSIR